MWQNPDEYHETSYGQVSAVWYGPAGEDGDAATVVSGRGNEFTFSDIQDVAGLIDDPPDRFLITSAFVFLGPEDENKELRNKVRIAAEIGSHQIAERGGSEEWASTLGEGVEMAS